MRVPKPVMGLPDAAGNTSDEFRMIGLARMISTSGSGSGTACSRSVFATGAGIVQDLRPKFRLGQSMSDDSTSR
jgi:hypothetical protein